MGSGCQGRRPSWQPSPPQHREPKCQAAYGPEGSELRVDSCPGVRQGRLSLSKTGIPVFSRKVKSLQDSAMFAGIGGQGRGPQCQGVLQAFPPACLPRARLRLETTGFSVPPTLTQMLALLHRGAPCKLSVKTFQPRSGRLPGLASVHALWP
jgi:hypothetical protein